MDKKFNPYEGMTLEPFPGATVAFIDKLLEMKRLKGCGDAIKDDRDWELMNFLYKGWKVLYPAQAYRFEQDMDDIRRHTVKEGVVEEGQGVIRHRMNVDEVLYRWIGIMFPFQKWDKKFVDNFVKHFPTFQAHT